MKVTRMRASATLLALASIGFAGSASAGLMTCERPEVSHSYMGVSRAPACSDKEASKPSVNKFVNQPGPSGGQQPDAWVSELSNRMLISSGDWRVVNVSGVAGNLSIIKLDRRPPAASIPEPGTLALLGIGLLGVGLIRRLKYS